MNIPEVADDEIHEADPRGVTFGISSIEDKAQAVAADVILIFSDYADRTAMAVTA